MVNKRGVITTGLNISLALLFVTSSFSVPYLSETKRIVHLPVTVSDNNCYGFIVPLPSPEKIDEHPELQYSMMNLVNDLLRLNVPVYWSNDPIEVFIKAIDDPAAAKARTFQPGSFIVPFTNISEYDAKIISVIYDYNISHELHKNTKRTDVFQLSDDIVLSEAYRLVEPKIAYYYDEGVYSNSLNWYVSTLYKSGFLSNEFLNDEDLIDRLDTDQFNVFIWPGGEIVEDIRSNVSIVTRLLKQNKIKDFVSDGGGYIGSCYGAFAASSGTRFYPVPLLPYYFSHIPSIGFLSLQDCFTSLGISCSINITVSESDSPVLFGVEGTLHNSQLRGGAVYTWLGDNTESLGVIKEVNSTIWTHWFRDLFSSNSSYAERIIDLWVKFTKDKTVWTTSNYGAGKVVTFGDHPEIGHINLQRIIHNSMFYVSSKTVDQVSITVSIPDSDVLSIGAKSKNISISDSSSDVFTDIYDLLDTTLSDYSRFNQISESIFNTTWSLIENNSMDISIAIGLFVSGMWEFRNTIARSIRYLHDTTDEENVQHYLSKIEDINNQMIQRNISIDTSFNQFKENIRHHFMELDRLNKLISIDLETMYNILNNYDGSSIQNESMLQISERLWDSSKNIEKNCPSLFFNSLRFLRETWYIYESS